MESFTAISLISLMLFHLALGIVFWTMDARNEKKSQEEFRLKTWQEHPIRSDPNVKLF